MIDAMDEKRLSQVPIFAGLGKRERKALAQRADEIDVREGKELAREGEFAYEFFVIESGTASVTVDGKQVGELGPGDFFGEVGILAAGQRTATVTATSPMELVVLTSGGLKAITRDQPEVGEAIRSEIERRLAADAERSG
jgi:CRP-like cAMP-binding protein